MRCIGTRADPGKNPYARDRWRAHSADPLEQPDVHLDLAPDRERRASTISERRPPSPSSTSSSRATRRPGTRSTGAHASARPSKVRRSSFGWTGACGPLPVSSPLRRLTSSTDSAACSVRNSGLGGRHDSDHEQHLHPGAGATRPGPVDPTSLHATLRASAYDHRSRPPSHPSAFLRPTGRLCEHHRPGGST